MFFDVIVSLLGFVDTTIIAIRYKHLFGTLKKYFLEKKSLGKTLTNKKASRSEKTSGSLFMYLKSQQRAAETQKCPTALIF